MAKLDVVVQVKDDASKQLQGIGKATQEMSAEFKKAGLAMMVASAAITAALVATVKAFADEEKGILRLSTAMKNVGLDYDANSAAIERNINALQRKTGIADNMQRDSLASLVRITRDTSEAFDLMELSMDVAVGTARDLESATTLIMYALSGNWGMLERYIPAIKEAQEEEQKWAMLRELFAGQAEEYGKSLSGMMASVKASFGDLAEMIGGVLAPVVKFFAAGLSKLLEMIKGVHPIVLKAGVGVGVLTAAMLALGGIIVTSAIAIKAWSVLAITQYIKALAAITKAVWLWVYAKLHALALMGPAGWAVIAAGIGIAAAAVYGLTRAVQSWTEIPTIAETTAESIRTSTADMANSLRDLAKQIKETEEQYAQSSDGMVQAAQRQLSVTAQVFADLPGMMKSELSEIRTELEATFGTLTGDLAAQFHDLFAIDALTEDTKAQLESLRTDLIATFQDLPWDVQKNFKDLFDISDEHAAALDMLKSTRDQMEETFGPLPNELAKQFEALIGHEKELAESAGVANMALVKQQAEALRAADAKGNLAEEAKRLGMSEDEARAAIAMANESLEEQEVVAYAAANKKKELSEIAEDLGMSEWELQEILDKANAGLKQQSLIDYKAGMGEFRMGTSEFMVPAFGRGGYVTKPTLAIVGDSGPEVISPLANYTDIDGRIGPLQPILPSGTGGGGTINVTIQAGAFMGDQAQARRFGRQVLDTIRHEEIRRTGVVK